MTLSRVVQEVTCQYIRIKYKNKEEDMNAELHQLKDIFSPGCVTLILNTNRTKPENIQDPITLKNLATEAEQRLHEMFDKRFAGAVMGNLNAIMEEIDHNYNLDSLVVFANEEMADFTRLPFSVENRVVIDNTFATRDLVRALHQEVSYYVLVLSRQRARLIEAHTDKVVREIRDLFPMKNRLWTTSKKFQSMAKGSDVLTEEFFNRVDKALNAMTMVNPLPVYIATETRNFDHYMKVADNKDRIAGHLNQNRDDEKDAQVVASMWPVVKEAAEKRHNERIAELNQAVSANKFVSDLNEIWQAIHEGKGKTLFVQKDYFQHAVLTDEGTIAPLNGATPNAGEAFIDDVIDEMIEINLNHGGDTVFLDGSELEKFDGVALITRY